MSDVFEIIFCCMAFPVFYISSKMNLLEVFAQRFCEWVSDLTMNTKIKNGLSPETKQTVLDDFMKGVE